MHCHPSDAGTPQTPEFAYRPVSLPDPTVTLSLSSWTRRCKQVGREALLSNEDGWQQVL